jgi:hypothetical protein
VARLVSREIQLWEGGQVKALIAGGSADLSSGASFSLFAIPSSNHLHDQLNRPRLHPHSPNLNFTLVPLSDLFSDCNQHFVIVRREKIIVIRLRMPKSEERVFKFPFVRSRKVDLIAELWRTMERIYRRLPLASG